MNKLMFFIFLYCQATMAYALATAKATVLVVDENDIPLEGVDAGLGFSIPKKSGWGSKSAGNRGLTDEEGKFVSSGETERILRYGARHPGYYSSSYEFTNFTGVSGILGFRKWQPWNPTLKVVLKKIKKPIAMYAYYTDWIDIPKNDEFIGYDLVKHDWISPYGSGVVSDFLFKLEGKYTDNLNHETHLSLKFFNVADGIQTFSLLDSKGSVFRSAHNAPLNGYQGKLTHSITMNAEKGRSESYSENANYYFRVRCNEDKPESCLYGKIYGDIEYDATGYLKFKYFLNPSSDDTNVEFDPKRNLFKNLKHKITTP